MRTKFTHRFLTLALLLAACSSAGQVKSDAEQPDSEREMAAVSDEPGLIQSLVSENQDIQAYNSERNRLVIKDASIDLLVKEADPVIFQINQIVADYGGYIVGSDTWIEREHKFATMRLGIPAAAFEKSLNDLRSLGAQVLKETASGQDVTAEYVDLGSKLINLEATAARVRQFLERANTVDEALQVNQKLSELEGQIEEVKGKMRFYEGRAAFSTVTINLIPEIPNPVPEIAPGWNPGTTLNRAISVLADLGKVLLDVGIWLLVVGGPVGLIAVAMTWVAKRWLRRRPTSSL
ncbi:MAG: DUF4349 domain-containing protein [Anaerolineales bacterium]|nr:MAG: DUF4349 domain-containing protein [Anaerolineales bacterium]